MIGHFLFPLSSKSFKINYVLCLRYIIHVLSILCWHVFCFTKKTCFIYIKNASLIQKHRSITLNWGCLCSKGMSFWRIKGVPFMRCISTHKWIWSRLCGRRVKRRHRAKWALQKKPLLSVYLQGYWCCIDALKPYKALSTNMFDKNLFSRQTLSNVSQTNMCLNVKRCKTSQKQSVIWLSVHWPDSIFYLMGESLIGKVLCLCTGILLLK